MIEPVSAHRTLVKSPPELWARLSDPAELARYLGEFGEIRITRLEAERTVAWEGDRARGTVALAPSGWGTRVTLSAQPASQASDPPSPAEPLDPPEPPVPDAPRLPDTAERVPPPLTAFPLLAVEAEPPPKRGFFARLFGRPGRAVDRREVEERARERDLVERPGVESAPLDEPAVAIAPMTAAGGAVHPAPPPPAPVDPPPAPPTEGPDREATTAVLEAALDDLGAAHHRPYSRG